MNNIPWSEFKHIQGSEIWPSHNPADSPFDKFTCIHCGEILHILMYGSRFICESSFEQKAERELMNHLNCCGEFQSVKDRKKYFKPDGSCTNICPWGYGVVISTELCIALPECKKEFGGKNDLY